jgi:hypothetical protein
MKSKIHERLIKKIKSVSKKLLALMVFSVPFWSDAQVAGEIINDQRKIAAEINYQLPGGIHEGLMVFDISVDMDGDVTYCSLVKSASTVVSSPLMLKARNLIISNLKFEQGPQFPQWHKGTVTIQVVKDSQ